LRQLRIAAPLAVVAILMLGTPAAAAPPTSETIVLTQVASDFTPIDWTSNGSFSDSGTWSTGLIAVGGGNSGNFAGEVKTTLVGSAGSFEMTFQTRNGSGRWEIGHGTGEYASLHGTGTFTTVESAGVSTFTCLGEVITS